jgi:CDP-glycerol glycerophosphotransferase (TagB/SpsB family)
MFTWRNRIKNRKISNGYVNNITYFLINNLLVNLLKKNNITLYFSYHYLLNYRLSSKYLLGKNKYIKIIEQNDISDIISKANLLITDFSSIIFDFIYRRKPFIMYIPDSNDPDLSNKYVEEYYELIHAIETDNISLLKKIIASGYRAEVMPPSESPLLYALDKNKINALSIMIEGGFDSHVEVEGEDDIYFIDIYDYKKIEEK